VSGSGVPVLHALCAAWRLAPETRVRLAEFDPADTASAGGDQEAAQARPKGLARTLNDLQDLLYAQKKHRVLLVLQGMDTAGKDSTIRRVFATVDPLGVRVANFRAPEPAEAERDYLWRVHAQVPRDGELVIFNRSHYEDYLVARVNGTLGRAALRARLGHIVAFERMLADEGTTLVKCFLHIGHAEQGRRLRERLEDPTKQWKFDYSDVRQRAQWDAYVRAYEEALGATSAPGAPWYVIPANHKWVRDLIVTAILVHTLRGLRMRYPPPPADLDQVQLD
jgi:PPK2 family polyphosphate:nucleotide phosphotransferase